MKTYEDGAAGHCLARRRGPGDGASGIEARLGRAKFFKALCFEGHSGKLALLTLMPPGAAIGGIRCALLLGAIAIRATKIVIVHETITVK